MHPLHLLPPSNLLRLSILVTIVFSSMTPAIFNLQELSIDSLQMIRGSHPHDDLECYANEPQIGSVEEHDKDGDQVRSVEEHDHDSDYMMDLDNMLNLFLR
ncbi:hypothetical protein L1987_49641 [Smallanthus sonchifolius]|uniref:Uncharacterized protein n=1 Tax=Smallanthus sonchifolius TaxID=185202 RepID=A0ACB9FUN4_9ASTR|nr:hypothetical protein L1987_49641 [Smallanthus sonchifolius]